MTVLDLITNSLRLIGALSTGEVPSANESDEALTILNDMLEQWSIQGLLVYQQTKETFALTANQNPHTMGPGGNFDTTRPTRILRANILKGTQEFYLEVIDTKKWADISIKTTSSSIPSYLMTDGAFPLLNINLWPIPSEANSLVIYSIKPIAAFAAITDDIALPPGYSRAIRYNLAAELAIEYGRAPHPKIEQIASESKAELVRQNTTAYIMRNDAVSLVTKKPFNWLIGE